MVALLTWGKMNVIHKASNLIVLFLLLVFPFIFFKFFFWISNIGLGLGFFFGEVAKEGKKVKRIKRLGLPKGGKGL